MHFRLGDYKKLQNFHPLSTYEYYINSLRFIQNKTNETFNVLYFCEDHDIDDVLETINRHFGDE